MCGGGRRFAPFGLLALVGRVGEVEVGRVVARAGVLCLVVHCPGRCFALVGLVALDVLVVVVEIVVGLVGLPLLAPRLLPVDPLRWLLFSPCRFFS